jgi:hypothetical protein
MHPASSRTVTLRADELLELLAHLQACEELLVALNANYEAAPASERLTGVVWSTLESHVLVDVDEGALADPAVLGLDAAAFDVAADLLEAMLDDDRLGLAVLFGDNVHGNGDELVSWATVRLRLAARAGDLRRFAAERREQRAASLAER